MRLSGNNYYDITSSEEESDVKLESIPILFISHDNNCEFHNSFIHSVQAIIKDDELGFKVGNGCIIQWNKSGGFLFCEAVKVDASLSNKDCEKKCIKHTLSNYGSISRFRKGDSST